MPTPQTKIGVVDSSSASSVDEHSPCELSIVIPAFEEARRLPPHLVAIRKHFEASRTSYEVIIVDDGGRDGTTRLVENLGRDWPELRLVRHPQNLGKGAALRTGIAAARGRTVLLTDADGATPIGEEKRLRATLASGADIAVGSRLLADPARRRDRHPFHNLLGRSFAAFARRVLGLPVSDPQCGFKMLRADVARELLPNCDEPGYLFDAQLLLHAARGGFRIIDLPVSWREVPGSKVRRFRDGWRMLRGLLRLRKQVNGIVSTRRNTHQSTELSCRNSQGITPSGFE